MVKDIEEFGAEFEAGLAKFGFLEHGEVHVAEAGPIDRVAAAVAERTSFRHREGSGIEPVGDGLWIGIWANASQAIRALVDEIAIPESVRPNVDGIGDACAQNSQRRNPPAREQLAVKSRGKEPMALTERHVIQEVEGKVVADVAGTVASLGLYVVEVLGVGSGNGRIFHIVNRVAEGVVCLEAQTSLARTANEGELQSVIRA